jgi:hypothetical protein
VFTIESTIEITAPLARILTAITGRNSLGHKVDHCDTSGIVMTCIAHEHNASWLGTTIALELCETANGTRIHLLQSGYRAMDEVYQRSREAWPYFLHSLASYMMTGTGEPIAKAA